MFGKSQPDRITSGLQKKKAIDNPKSMQNKIVLITGATNGIGKQTALTLAKMGAQVIITGRNKPAGEAAVAELKQASGAPKVDLLLADLSTRAGVHALAEQFKQKYDRLDVLINNAGLAASERRLTKDGVESNFAVNVIAPFLLTHLLLDRLKASPSARVITLMGGEARGNIELDNLQAERSFAGLNTYSHSKLIMMAIMLEFAQRAQGSHVTLNICYPGQASTSMTRSVTPGMLPGFMRFLFPLFKLAVRDDGGKSAAKASRSSVYLASSAEVEGVNGKYFDTHSKLVDWPAPVIDQTTRQQLWAIAEQISHT
ncbi:MAG: SDR family NAD(P)-dependent oxidoreductase [Chloroflexi bacterium]|nr:SDR family NAD(P)-dependent oxidoreductase [Chloroflexota bacterium]